MTAFHFHRWVFFGVKGDFGLDLHLMTHDSVFMYFASAVAVDIDELGLLYIVPGSHFDTATFILAFNVLRYMDCNAMGLTSAVAAPVSTRRRHRPHQLQFSPLYISVAKSSVDFLVAGEACRG